MPIDHKSKRLEESLRIERNRQLVGCALFSFGSVVLIMGILSLFLLAPESQITAELTVVNYHEKQDKDDKPEKKQPKEAVPKKPSAPTSHVSKFIHSHALSNVSVPVHEIDVELPSVDLGESLDFGQMSSNGFRRGRSNGNANGHGGNVVSYDDSKSSAQRVAYVIDCSGSMYGVKEVLMLNELSRQLAELGDDMHYQLIPFSGPPWDRGSSNQRSTKQPPGWLEASDTQKKASLAYIEKNPLRKWANRWPVGLNTALHMNPKPNVIIFMTDGAYGSQTCALAGWVGTKAKNQNIIINTVAMTRPKTKDAMHKISNSSGGTYVQIEQDGTRIDGQGNPIKRSP